MKDRQTTLKEGISRAFSSAEEKMHLTLPDHLLMAFSSSAHTRDIDPSTGQPFASFYRWLWYEQPPGCGLCTSRFLNVSDLVYLLRRARDNMAEKDCGTIDALIEDLDKGIGASRGKGGRPKKVKENRGSATPVSNGRHGRTRHAVTLRARLAESADPKERAAYRDYLDGKYKTVHQAAVACGMVKSGHDPLTRLKEYWKKATVTARETFLEWVKEAGTP